MGREGEGERQCEGYTVVINKRKETIWKIRGLTVDKFQCCCLKSKTLLLIKYVATSKPVICGEKFNSAFYLDFDFAAPNALCHISL